MMWFIFVRILFMSIAMSAAGLAVLLISRIFGGVLTKSRIYYLWLLPLAAALIPLSMNTPAVKLNIPQKSISYTGVYSKAAQTAKSTDSTAVVQTENTAANTAVKTAYTKEAAPTAIKINYKTAIPTAYLICVLILLMRYAVRNVRFRRKMKLCLEKISLPFEYECREKIAFYKKAEILSIDADCSPFVFGILHPRVAVPHGVIEKEAFIHELVHIKRKDLLYLLAADIAKTVHFFNPLVYLFAGNIRRLMELSCDERAASVMSVSERITYSRSIISCCKTNCAGAACLSESGENIKERITEIMDRKTYSKQKKFLSALIVIAMIITQTALAAAVGSKTPAKSYVINNSSNVYSVVYYDGENSYYSGRSGIGTNVATIVNSPLFKGFSADLKIKFYDNYPPREGNADDNSFIASLHIEMDKHIKSIEDGKHWQGLFTVTINGEVIMDSAPGYLNYIPGDYARDVSRLVIIDGKKTIDVEKMDFGTKSDDIINAQYVESKAETFQPTESYLLGGTTQMSWKNGKDSSDGVNDWLYLTIYGNRKESRLFCKEIPFIGNYYIVADSDSRFTYKGNSVRGKFLLQYSGGIHADEFNATLSGLGTDTLKLVSDDKSISVTMKVYERKGEEPYRSPSLVSKGLRNGLEDGGDFSDTCVEYFERIRLSDLPFTLTLSDDKTAVILEIKDGFAPLGWFYSYSSYAGDDKDVYACGKSENSPSQVKLPICGVDLASHNLQFNYYSAEPFVSMYHTDIMFKVADGEIKYSSCANYITENKGYSGSEGEKMLDKYMLAAYKSILDRD